MLAETPSTATRVHFPTRSTTWLGICLGALVTAGTFASCSSAGGDEGGDEPEDEFLEQEEEGETNCSTTVEELVLILDLNNDSIPSWGQLNCYAAGLTRLDYPDQVIMVADVPPATDGSDPWPGLWNNLQEFNSYLEDWPENEVSGLTDFPPFTSIDGNSPFYWESDARWDLKLRSMALNALWVKEQGYRARVTYFNSPTFSEQENWDKLGAEDVDSPESFLEWFRTVYIPHYEDLAEMAELVQAEILMPWDVEPGSMIRSFGDDWLDDMTTGAQVTLQQTMIDELAAALRPLYSGTLSIIIYDRYAFGQHWDQINVSAWDQVNFVLFTEGDLTATEMYLDDQLEGYQTIIERSGIPWIAQEVTVDGDYHRNLLGPSDPTFEEIEEDIYRMIFTKLSEQEIKPIGIGLTTGYIETEGAETYVRQALADVAENGF